MDLNTNWLLNFGAGFALAFGISVGGRVHNRLRTAWQLLPALPIIAGVALDGPHGAARWLAFLVMQAKDLDPLVLGIVAGRVSATLIFPPANRGGRT